MKENFEEALRVVNDVAQKNPEKEKVSETLNSRLKEGIEIAHEKYEDLDEMIPEAARIKVFELQKEKQEIMSWPRENLEKIANEEGVESYTKNAQSSRNPYIVTPNMEVLCENGESVKVTKGQLSTDGEWGIEYRLDKEVKRDVKRRFVVSEAKRGMRELLDKQIATAEFLRTIPKWVDGPMKAHMVGAKVGYGAVLSGNFEKSFEGSKGGGLVAEKLITTFLEAFQIDNDAPYTFRHGDVFDDYERKVDCLISIPTHTRGIKAETGDGGNVGIQLYVGNQKDQKQHKKEQIQESKKRFGLKDLNDIVLVTIPKTHSGDYYLRWKEEGKKPGGPMKLWEEPMKEKIFFGVLKNFFTDEKISEMWKGILDEAPETLSEPTASEKPKKEEGFSRQDSETEKFENLKKIKDSDERVAEVKKLNEREQSLLAKIAELDESPPVRSVAVKKLNFSMREVLQTLLKNEKNNNVQQTIRVRLEKIEKQKKS
jgi:hypothetical protein